MVATVRQRLIFCMLNEKPLLYTSYTITITYLSETLISTCYFSTFTSTILLKNIQRQNQMFSKFLSIVFFIVFSFYF